MEQESEADHLSEHKKKKKKIVSYRPHNNNHYQVTSKSIDDQEVQLNIANIDLKIDPTTSSNKNLASLRSNYPSNSDIDNIHQNSKHFTVESSSKVFKLDDPPEMNYVGIDSNKNNQALPKPKSLIQMKCKDTSSDIPKPTEHGTKYKKAIEIKFHCFICDTKIKSLNDWESHTITTDHIEKCMNKNDYISYDCGGCKTFFFGSKEQILKHCKDIHKDISGLPCVFKCMKEVFHQCIFISPTNWKSWSYCGPCKSYSFLKMKCYSSNHIFKKTLNFNCNTCLINFVCSQEVYNKHLMSCEHIMLEYFQSKKDVENPETKTMCNLKLPPIFLNRFTINNVKATCNDCKLQMVSNEKAITVHLTECIKKTDIGKKNTLKIKTYFCAVCNETIPDFNQWKFHLILSSHLIKCYDIHDLVSYTCELCFLHCYGVVRHVINHQLIHPNNSETNLSKFMAFNFQRINKDIKTKNFYYCEECETYAEINSNSDHWNKSHKTKLKRIVCQPCRTEFFCIEENELFIKHILSSEHIVLTYVATKNLLSELKPQPLNTINQKACGSKSTLNKNKVLFNVKPYLIFFQNVKNDNKTMCKSCDDLIDFNQNDLLSHLLICKHGLIESIPQSNLNYFQCLECKFHSINKDTWKKHAITHEKLNPNILYSYICKSCNILVYGEMNDIELHLSTEHKITIESMPVDTILMAKQLRKNNYASKTSDIMSFCEPCNKMFKSNENPNHFNTDSHASVSSDNIELFYCKDCKVEFYTSLKAYEYHKLTVEHIIMSSDHRNIEISNLLKPVKLLKLDTYLFDFVTDQDRYDATLNIGFFCFLCDYLCFKLDAWKMHINSRKHVNFSKVLSMDHRCKICKTLMFGQRQHMFEHYSNRFHSMLRQFKSMTSTAVSKINSETKQAYNVEPTSENQASVINANISRESSSPDNEVNSLTKMMNKLSVESNIHKESSLEESTSNNTNETHLMTETMDAFCVESNHCQDKKMLEESTTYINETLLMKKSLNKLDLEITTQNYSNFYGLKINMLKELLNQNKEITPQICYYCVSCDFITAIYKNWEEHNLTDHCNGVEVRHKVFCEICNLYQIGLYKNLDKHINTIEHKNMEDFQNLNSNNVKKKYNKTKKSENGNLTSDNPSDITDTSKTEIDQNNSINTEKKEESIHKVMIEIKGVKPQYKQNGWVEIKKIFACYGFFVTYIKSNSVVLLFRKLSYFRRMLKDKEKLEKKHEFTICILKNEEYKLPELDETTVLEFGNKEVLLKAINTQLMAINQEISNPDISDRLILLINSIHSCAGQHFRGSKTYPFGSRMSGLALKDSDVDLYFDIADTFCGELSHDLYAQEDLVRYFGKVFRSQKNEYKQIQLITGARVPIVKFLHAPSRLYCDLSFKSGLSTHNTKLVRLYLSLDERVHWIVCAVVKHWALQNDLKNQSMFTSYALAWLVLFYLMTIHVIPTLLDLRIYADYSNDPSRSDVMFIEDWDCTFCTLKKIKANWRVPVIPCWDLLFGFFQFYSDANRLKKFVFCPISGTAIPRNIFFNIPISNDQDKFGFNKKKYGKPLEWCIRLKENFRGEGLAVQDPFDLFHNITKTIVPRKLEIFTHLCNKTMQVMNNGVLPYYA